MEELYSNNNSIATLNFRVFNRILTDFIPKLLCSDENTLNDMLPDFISICTKNVHTYFYTQAVLAKLIRGGIDPAVRVSQELFLVARKKSPAVAALLSTAFANSSDRTSESESGSAKAVTEAINAGLSRAEFSGDEIAQIYNAYSEDRALSPALLSNFAVIETFIHQLFVPSDDQSIDHAKLITLLCYATTYKSDSKLSSSQSQQQQSSTEESKSTAEPTPEATTTTATKEGDKEDVAMTVNNSRGTEPLAASLRRKSTAFRELEEIVTSVVPLCTRDIVHARDPVALPRVADAVKRSALMALGVVEWLRSDLLSPSFFKIVTFSDINRVYFELVRLVLSRYPAHRRAVFGLLTDCYTTRVPEKISEDFRLEVIRLFIDLFLTGYTKPVLEQLSAWAEQRALDLSHLRTFFENVLARVERPYSPAFMCQMVETIGRECVYSSLAAHNLERQKNTYRAVKCFLAVCSDSSADLPIDCSKTVAFLLSSVFTNKI